MIKLLYKMQGYLVKERVTDSFFQYQIILCCVVWIYSSNPLYADAELPLLGENASINLAKEIELGRGLYLKLKEHGYVIDDPLLSRYLSDIGQSLLASLDFRARDYHFYLVNDSSVNAFATPGGYIGVNVGLIAMTSSEDELASVLSHEIAHVELMHSMQMIDQAKDANLTSVIAMLAAILVSGSNPDAATAILYTGIAGSTQSMINFTRTNEYEADRVGVELLKKSNYDPSAMVDFMMLLQSRESGGELSSIEYIRTHPVSSNRVAEIRARLKRESAQQVYPANRFQQFKDYLFYQYLSHVEKRRYSQFYEALLLTKNGQYAHAETLFRTLIKEDPDSIWYSYALAENLEFQKRREEARKIYQSLMLLYPDELAIGVRIVNILRLDNREVEALELALKLSRKHEKNPQVYKLLVGLYGALGMPLLKDLSEANFHWFSGHKKQAEKLYKSLLIKGNLDAANEEKIREKLNKI